MTNEERERLVKLLNLTSSEIDGEVLNAIRAANRILKKRDMTFSDIIGAEPEKPVSQESPQQQANDWLAEIVRRQNEELRKRQEQQRTHASGWYYNIGIKF